MGWLPGFTAVVGGGAAADRASSGTVSAIGGAAEPVLLSEPARDGIPYGIADAAWPISVLLMTVVGVATVRAGALPGWRRFAPVLCGPTLPASVAVAAVMGESAIGPAFGVLTTSALAALGYAVATAIPVGTAGGNLHREIQP